MSRIVNADFFADSNDIGQNVSIKKPLEAEGSIADTLLQLGASGAKMADIASFGLTTKAGSGVGAYGQKALEKLGLIASSNKTISELYDENLKTNEAEMERLPIGAKIGSTAVGAVASAPINILKGIGLTNALSKGANIIKLAPSLIKAGKVAEPIIESGVQSGLDAGLRGNDISDALTKGLALRAGLGVASKGLEKTSKIAGDFAQGTQNKLLGIKKSDIKKSLLKDVVESNEKAPIIESANRLFKNKSLTAGEGIENYLKIKNEIQEIGANIKNQLKLADSFQEKTIKPKFTMVGKYLSSLDPSNQKEATILFKGLFNDFNKKNLTISQLEKTKSAYQKEGKLAFGASATDNLKANLKAKMSTDIKSAINKELEKPIYKKELGSDFLESIKKQRAELADRYKVLPALKSAKAVEEYGTDLNAQLVQTMRTSGGYGVPAIIANNKTGALGALGTLLGGGLLQSKAGQKSLLSLLRGVEKSAGATSKTGNLLKGETGKGKEFDAITQLVRQSSNIKNSKKDEEAEQVMPPELNKNIVNSSFFEEELPKNNKKISQIDAILDALKMVESGGNPNAISKAGARGAYQFMPATAKSYGVDLFDENESDDRLGAFNLLQDEQEALGDLPSALASYNAGRPAVLRARKKAGSNKFNDYARYLPKETQDYVPKINNALAKILG